MKSIEKKLRTDAQRRAQNKYEAKTYKVAACKILKTKYEKFDEYCKAHGTTVNKELARFVDSCIGE